MSILRMRILVLLDRYKKVTAVAHELNLKQPTVSFHMKKMEEEWGLTLFELKTGKVLLTEAGRTLHHYAQQIDGLYGEAQVRMQALRHTGRNPFIIGCTDTAALLLLQSAVFQNSQVPEDMLLSIRTSGEQELYAMLASGSIDLVLCGLELTHPALQCELVAEDELALIIPPDHPLTRYSGPGSYRLSGQPFALLNEESLMRIVRQWENEEQIALQVKQETDRVDFALQAVRTGGCLSILPARLNQQASSGSFPSIKLPGKLPVWKLYAAWRSDYPRPQLMQRVMDRLRVAMQG
ncbi:LysR family transcriptional regulator [Paenibacillus nasutitermitis]|uniref:LysR family transcriptional regulator n=1 Tax=Paenibacillus nasutitermitis TaxID=1652958 RepID=A0A917DN21_9BACL|nr:LysR family transcriptional regulator [Paenibacillus nasutitermitis]GGD52684.1 LysR family transcriptional regulator [Paenibacillus nasutitermitis]